MDLASAWTIEKLVSDCDKAVRAEKVYFRGVKENIQHVKPHWGTRGSRRTLSFIKRRWTPVYSASNASLPMFSRQLIGTNKRNTKRATPSGNVSSHSPRRLRTEIDLLCSLHRHIYSSFKKTRLHASTCRNIQEKKTSLLGWNTRKMFCPAILSQLTKRQTRVGRTRPQRTTPTKVSHKKVTEPNGPVFRPNMSTTWCIPALD